MLERALGYSIDVNALEAQAHPAALDMLLTGRGVGRIVSEPEIVTRRDLQ